MRLGSALLCGCLTAVASIASADILVVGDSISAAYGIDKSAGWVSLLEQKLEGECATLNVYNASVSGETSAGGAARLPALLAAHTPSVVVIELGGNDGLRGMPPVQMKQNLVRMITVSREAGAEPLLFGMRIPPNYGEAYTRMFEAVFTQVAQEQEVPLLPFFLDGVGGEPSLMQEDGIHPVASAQPRLLENAWTLLADVVRRHCE
ncbi:lipolytic protein [Isoalcanivorax pacificus W11-5]|uniref:Lipolytic protein n=1 Tax=Isoalcanivorax pacificus W11-5 TaxID=391936 RepID=A0A0B4XNB8_9GAMM|nr:arylesterase [Isoalcanivorax pacificus]AJD47948.1 lipolytic protein [Isoalcanivorax pacificus W11-5]